MNLIALLRFKSITFCLVIYICFLGFALSAQNDGPLDVRILIDISGSMKQNDPNNLRQPALELLIDLLPDDSKVGVWSFGTFVNMLVKHDQVDQKWREQAKQKIESINNLGQRTNLAQALITSAYDFQFANYKPGTHFILLTDGMVDVSRDKTLNLIERNRILEKILPNFKQKKAIIHTIALSDQADFSLLQQLSIQTQGVAGTAYDADDLTPIFLKAFDRLVSTEQVSLVDNQFVIDQTIDEYTALIFHSAGEKILLRSPNGQLIDQKSPRNDVKWKSLNTYELITVKQPKFGKWKIEGNIDPLSRVSIISDLSLNISDLPSNLYSHQIPEFATWLSGEYITGDMNPEDGSNRIMDESLLSLVNVFVDIKQNGQSVYNKQLNKQLDEFVFDDNFFLKQGEYAIQVNLSSPTFERKLVKNIVLRSAFSVESLGISKPEEYYLLRVYQNDNSIESASISIKGLVNNQMVDFEKTDHGYWEYKQLNEAGQMALEFNVLANYKRGLVAVDQQKIAQLTLSFPINSNSKVKLTQPIAIKPDKPEVMEPMVKTQLSDPDVVIGFNKLIMPTIEMANNSKPAEVEIITLPDKPEIDEDDQWGENMPEPEIVDDSLSVLTLMLSSLPLLILLGGGFWWFNRLTKNDELESENDGYTQAEKEALQALDEDISTPTADLVMDSGDSSLNKDLEVLNEAELPLPDIDLNETPKNEINDEIDVNFDSDLDAPSIESENQESDNSNDKDVIEQSLDEALDNDIGSDFGGDLAEGLEEDLESVPVTDALQEFDQQVSDQEEVDDSDPFEEIETDETFEEIPGLDDEIIENEDKNKDADFDIDIGVDSLDSSGLDDLDLEKDDDPFENDEDEEK
ncbi:MAG: VWA domain-containing protein [Saccharospirillaceae bacterium]|nr:VWA domain-containing protein [Pseudomonadales bacterium]NRB78850.1 VWA domain-containing protein [Saccharospirillaceae bacterium]